MFESCKNIEELKKEYKKAAIKFHPDSKTGDAEKMKEVNAEYEKMFRVLKNRVVYDTDEAKTYNSKETSADFVEIINAFGGYDGIEIEICGTWVWITGATFQIKEELKNNGFRFSKGKKAWYWTKSEMKKKRGYYSMKEIRERYGSDVIKAERKETNRIGAAM